MNKKILLLLLVTTSLFSYDVKLNGTSDFQIIKSKISTDTVIQSIKKNPFDPKEIEQLVQEEQSKSSNNLATKNELLQAFATLKTISNYRLHDKFTINQIKNKINNSILESYSDFNIPLIFSYKISFENESKAITKLNYEINNYIMKHHSVSFVNTQISTSNAKIQTFNIDEIKYGIVQHTNKKLDIKREFKQDGTTTLIGVKKVLFYPFKRLTSNSSSQASVLATSKKKNNLNEISIYAISKNKENIDTVFQADILQKMKEFQENEDIQYEEFSQTKLDHKSYINKIQEEYQELIYKLYNVAPLCDTFFCYKTTIENKFNSEDTKTFDKTYYYHYPIPSSASFGAGYSMAVYQFIADLKQSTEIFYNVKEQSISEDTLNETKSQQQLGIYFDKVRIGTYIQNDTTNVFFKIKILSENTNPCEDIALGKDYHKKLDMQFLKYKSNNGQTIALAKTETTVKQFKLFLQDTKEQKSNLFASKHCYTSFLKSKNNTPVSCLNSHGVLSFFQWLNALDNNDDATYRLPTNEEWSYIASCGGKISYCWGNQKTQIDYNENIKPNKKSFKEAIKVGSYKASKSGLYDMCGNVSEYCMKKFAGRLQMKTIGGSYKQNQVDVNKVNNYKKGKDIGFRILKEY